MSQSVSKAQCFHRMPESPFYPPLLRKETNPRYHWKNVVLPQNQRRQEHRCTRRLRDPPYRSAIPAPSVQQPSSSCLPQSSGLSTRPSSQYVVHCSILIQLLLDGASSTWPSFQGLLAGEKRGHSRIPLFRTSRSLRRLSSASVAARIFIAVVAASPARYRSLSAKREGSCRTCLQCLDKCC